jgi:Leucine-rich repeat (LRR) protein
LFLLKNLEKLNLEFNKLKLIPTELGNLINLKQIFLNNNKLGQLYLNHNKLEFLPSELGLLKKL